MFIEQLNKIAKYIEELNSITQQNLIDSYKTLHLIVV